MIINNKHTGSQFNNHLLHEDAVSREHVSFQGQAALKMSPDMIAENASKLLKNPNPLYQGINKLGYKYLQHFENDGRELGALPLFLFAIVYMVGNRYLKARNKDERREVLTRDSLTGFTAFFFVYAIRRALSKIMEKKIGVPAVVKTTDGKVKLVDWLSRKTGGLYLKSYEEIGETYSAKTASQLKYYKTYIPLGLGEKFLASLPGNAQDALQELQKKYKFFKPGTNVTKLMAKNKLVKEQVDIVLHAIEKTIVPRAKIAKVIPDAISTIFTVILLGFFIPRFNIIHTKNIYKEKGNQDKAIKSVISPQSNGTVGSALPHDKKKLTLSTHHLTQ